MNPNSVIVLKALLAGREVPFENRIIVLEDGKIWMKSKRYSVENGIKSPKED